jgi:ornithine cyclodeaminase/alanine dehydrogenase-like protein (mu-crystallin family)
MRILTEEESARLVGEELALAAARLAFLATSEGVTFPVVIAHGSDTRNRFTLKSGATVAAAGVKIGSYWPGNEAQGLPRHSSTVILLDQDTGRIAAVVEAAAANAFRTAAADALAVQTLARPEAAVLAVIGTGHQALYEARAVARVRPLTQILVAGRNAAAAEQLAVRVRGATGVPTSPADPEAACRTADIIVTATTATTPLLAADWVRPGTHISAMGADARGKQELPPQLFTRARLFCDLPDQSRSIGEFQHAMDDAELTSLGEILHGRATGRRDADEITIFDSSGFAIQDLTLAVALLDKAAQYRW